MNILDAFIFEYNNARFDTSLILMELKSTILTKLKRGLMVMVAFGGFLHPLMGVIVHRCLDLRR